jgi:hypothetical protein
MSRGGFVAAVLAQKAGQALAVRRAFLGGWDAVGSVGKAGPGKEARLVFMGHALMENRNGFVIGAMATRASG